MTDDRNIDVYRIGMLYALHFDWRALIIGRRWTGNTWREIKHLTRLARKGEWRQVRTSFHGWHAEHRYAGSRCGIGWTRKAALRDLRQHLDSVNQQPR